MNLKDGLIWLSALYLFGRFIGRAFNYGTNIAISRGLGAEALGMFAIGIVIVQLGSLLSRIGLDEATQRFIPEYIESNSHAELRGLVRVGIAVPMLAGSFVAICLVLLNQSVLPLVGTESFSQLFPFFAAIPFHASMVVLTDATRGLKETKYVVVIRNILRAGFTVLIAIVGVYVFADLRIVFAGYLLSVLIAFVVAALVFRRTEEFRVSVSPTYELRTIFSFALPMMAITAVGLLNYRIDILMLTALTGEEQVGLYQAAFTTALLLTTVTESATVIYPSLITEARKRNQIHRIQLFYTVITKWTTALVASGVFGLYLFSADILSVFDIANREVVITLQVLAVAQLGAVATGPGGQTLKMLGYERVVVVNTLSLLLINIALNYWLISRYGIIGAAIATAVAKLAVNILQLGQVWYFLDLVPYSWSYWKGAAASAATVPIMLAAHRLQAGPLRVALAASSSLFVFFTVWYWLGLSSEDKIITESLK